MSNLNSRIIKLNRTNKYVKKSLIYFERIIYCITSTNFINNFDLMAIHLKFLRFFWVMKHENYKQLYHVTSS